MKSIKISIKGIHCGGCLNRINQIITIQGGDRFDFDFATMTGTIAYEGNLEHVSDFSNAIENAGYQVHILSVQEED
ncbi:MAG: heavy-metal-associated domain-containing protein [Acholeplasmataceae bacterium]|jgi:copper chaperone CopZ|nr:heavy-metal-associated domain-containing protein [Acholeplasmataceae bacterium]